MANPNLRNGNGMTCIKRMDFDSEAFGLQYYRVQEFDGDLLPIAIDKLKSDSEPLVIDAKLPADEIESARLLMALGFRKLCTQLILVHPLSQDQPPSDIPVDRTLQLDEAATWEHARNFRFDRFSLDPLLPAEGRQRLYFNWISNSTTQGKKLIAHLGDDFCSFSEGAEEIIIDLVSILRPRQGVGTKLIDAVIGYAQSRGLQRVRVTTECENKPAWNLYLQRGFEVSGFISVFHLVKRAPLQEEAGCVVAAT